MIDFDIFTSLTFDLSTSKIYWRNRRTARNILWWVTAKKNNFCIFSSLTLTLQCQNYNVEMKGRCRTARSLFEVNWTIAMMRHSPKQYCLPAVTRVEH